MVTESVKVGEKAPALADEKVAVSASESGWASGPSLVLDLAEA